MSYPLHFNLLPSRTGHCGVGIGSWKILAKRTMEQAGERSISAFEGKEASYRNGECPTGYQLLNINLGETSR